MLFDKYNVSCKFKQIKNKFHILVMTTNWIKNKLSQTTIERWTLKTLYYIDIQVMKSCTQFKGSTNNVGIIKIEVLSKMHIV